MAQVRRSRASRSAPVNGGNVAVLDEEAVVQFVEREADRVTVREALAQPADVTLPFFERLATCREPLVYIYRLEPKVQNADGQPAYIEKHIGAVDEDYLSEHHGGGVYKLIAKLSEADGLGSFEGRAVIQGNPKIQAGQQLKNSGDATQAGAPAGTQDVAGIVKQVIEGLQAKNIGMDQAIAQISAAAMGANDIQRKILEKQLLSDVEPKKSGVEGIREVLALVKELQPPAPPRDETTAQLIKIALENIRKPAEPAGSPRSAIEEMGLLKDVLGVDSLAEAAQKMSRAGRSDDIWSKLVELGGQFVPQIPTILQHISVMQENNFRRAIYLQSLNGQQAPHTRVPVGVVEAAAPAVAPAQRATRAPIPHDAPAIVSEQTIPPGPVVEAQEQPAAENEALMLENMLKQIVAQWDHNATGADTAGVLEDLYPMQYSLLRQAPQFQDFEQVRQFAFTNPILHQIVAGFEDAEDAKDYEIFLRDFWQTMTGKIAPELPATPA